MITVRAAKVSSAVLVKSNCLTSSPNNAKTVNIVIQRVVQLESRIFVIIEQQFWYFGGLYTIISSFKASYSECKCWVKS